MAEDAHSAHIGSYHSDSAFEYCLRVARLQARASAESALAKFYDEAGDPLIHGGCHA